MRLQEDRGGGGAEAGVVGNEAGECWALRAAVWVSDLTLCVMGAAKFGGPQEHRVQEPKTILTGHQLQGWGSHNHLQVQ